ncbi:FUSC family protein [Sabulilitoribacter multivorans]|uniref:FUSC family protein n=1 Tax=Flaviramulus multivorans TaxID=1304750 RepID=A0ABS9IMJ2_9FLAO|nr:FUSC family protein [Flaviramulus multivorans]MCF7561824.1 FUSC family protein [Flaviramulus multivorans]
MKKLFTILALVASVVAIIFSVLPISNLAIFPAIAALIFGLIAFYLSKKSGNVKKIIQFTFLLTIMALSITIYKALFTKTEVANTETLEATETKLEEEAIEELEELEFDDIEIEDELENISVDE